MRLLIGAALVASVAVNLLLATRAGRCGGVHQPRAVQSREVPRDPVAPVVEPSAVRAELDALRADVVRLRDEAVAMQQRPPSEPQQSSPIQEGESQIAATARELGIDEQALRSAVALASRELEAAEQRTGERAAALPPDLPDAQMEQAYEAINAEYFAARKIAMRHVEALLDGRDAHARFREGLDGWLDFARQE